ncbi:hypothetical protein YC2023_107598 [Brassica napus]
MGGRCPRVFVGDPSGGSVGTKAVGSDQEIDGVWSPDEASIPVVLHLPPPFGESWVRVGSFLSRCCRTGLGVSVAARVESLDCIRVSFGVSISQTRALDCGNAYFDLFSHNNCHLVVIAQCLQAGPLRVDKWFEGWRQQPPVFIPNDGTACLWTLFVLSVFPLLQGLSRLSLWELAATGVSFFSFHSLGGINASLSLVRT